MINKTELAKEIKTQLAPEQSFQGRLEALQERVDTMTDALAWFMATYAAEHNLDDEAINGDEGLTDWT